MLQCLPCWHKNQMEGNMVGEGEGENRGINKVGSSIEIVHSLNLLPQQRNRNANNWHGVQRKGLNFIHKSQRNEQGSSLPSNQFCHTAMQRLGPSTSISSGKTGSNTFQNILVTPSLQKVKRRIYLSVMIYGTDKPVYKCDWEMHNSRQNSLEANHFVGAQSS